MLYLKNSLALAHEFIEENVKKGDIVIDATAGRGYDTAFLCSLVGESGFVYAFDIQEEAIESSRRLLSERGYLHLVRLILDGHENMDKYDFGGSVSAVVFNFGYLPAGDHSIGTTPETSKIAIEKALKIVKEGGIVSLCVYYGGDSGFFEKDAILEFIEGIDYRRFTVLKREFSNRKNCPPIVIDIQKHILNN